MSESSDESTDKKPTLVRFDFPPGMAAEAIAAALRAAHARVMAERESTQAPHRDDPAH